MVAKAGLKVLLDFITNCKLFHLDHFTVVSTVRNCEILFDQRSHIT
jgi:hypothetical protein